MLEFQACDAVLSLIVVGMMLTFLYLTRDWPEERFDEIFGVRHGRR